MNRRPHSFALAACALAAAVMLSACGGGEATSPDTVAPTVTITSSAAGTTAIGAVTFTFTFSEDVGTSFTAEDVLVSGGGAGAFTRVSGTVATLVVTPTAEAAGSVSVSVAAAKFVDAANNANAAAAALEQGYNTVTATAASGSTGNCTAAPCIAFDAAALKLAAFGALGAEVVVDPADASNKVAKLVKAAASETWAGVTIDPAGTGANTVPAIGFGTSKVVTLRVYSPAAGELVMLKVENSTDGAINMEARATTTKAGAWETLSFNFAAPSAGAYDASKTYDRISVFPHFDAKVAADTVFYIDELNYSAVAGSGGGTSSGTATTVTFDTAEIKLGAFGALGAEVAADPVDAANKAAKLVKAAASETWAGATLDPAGTGANTVTPLDLATSKVVTMRVFSPAAGKLVMLKIENSTDGAINMEARATTTQTGAWETLSFDFAAPSAGSYDASKTYDRISVFPDFDSKVTADTVYYVDDVSYTGKAATSTGGGTGGGTSAGGLVTLTAGKFASNYAETPTPWKSLEGGTAGRYIDTGVATQDWWSGLAAGDATPSYYFGYGIDSGAKPWGFGAFVNAPGNGTANVGGYSNLRVSVWGNDELVNTKPTFTVILKGPAVAGCTSELKSSLSVAAAGVQTYTLPLAGFTLQTACGYASAAAALAAGVNEVHVQVLGANVQYTTKAAGAGNFYANGLNMGPISFN